MKSTILDYLYRDASNNKERSSVVLKGAMSEIQYQEICSCLYEDNFFLPLQVGLAPNRFDTVTEDDHVWFELDGYCVSDTPAPDNAMTVEKLVAKFRKAAEDGWDIMKYGDLYC